METYLSNLPSNKKGNKLTIKAPKLTSYQEAILNSGARYTITEASTKTGKTASHIFWLFSKALKGQHGQNFWWVAPTYAQTEMVYKRMKAHVKKSDFFGANDTKLRLTLPNGANIQFRSADRPDNLYGDDVYAAVFDEFTRAKEDAWFALRSTLTATRGECKLIGNVRGKKNWGWRLAQRAKAGEPGYAYFKITCWDAVNEGILSKDEIEQAQRDLPEQIFNELYLAEASENGACPFSAEAIKKALAPMSTDRVVCFGIDLAKSVDWTVIIGLDKNMQVCYFERFQSDWRQTVNRILRLPRVPMKVDSTGVGDPIVEDLQKRRGRTVHSFKFSSSSKQQLMEGLSLVIQNERLKFPEGVISDELESFEFEYTRTGVRYSAPQGLHDDCVCSLALAVDCYRNNRNTGHYDIR